jgi:hypothetical protein
MNSALPPYLKDAIMDSRQYSVVQGVTLLAFLYVPRTLAKTQLHCTVWDSTEAEASRSVCLLHTEVDFRPLSQESLRAKAYYGGDEGRVNVTAYHRVETKMAASSSIPGQAPPDLPSLLLDGRICYIGMAVRPISCPGQGRRKRTLDSFRQGLARILPSWMYYMGSWRGRQVRMLLGLIPTMLRKRVARGRLSKDDAVGHVVSQVCHEVLPGCWRS